MGHFLLTEEYLDLTLGFLLKCLSVTAPHRPHSLKRPVLACLSGAWRFCRLAVAQMLKPHLATHRKLSDALAVRNITIPFSTLVEVVSTA